MKLSNSGGGATVAVMVPPKYLRACFHPVFMDKFSVNEPGRILFVAGFWFDKIFEVYLPRGVVSRFWYLESQECQTPPKALITAVCTEFTANMYTSVGTYMSVGKWTRSNALPCFILHPYTLHNVIRVYMDFLAPRGKRYLNISQSFSLLPPAIFINTHESWNSTCYARRPCNSCTIEFLSCVKNITCAEMLRVSKEDQKKKKKKTKLSRMKCDAEAVGYEKSFAILTPDIYKTFLFFLSLTIENVISISIFKHGLNVKR